MLPVFRCFLFGLGALWSGAALAQAAASTPEIDESKIPEWVKRQARSPYKVIIDSNSVKTKPAPAPAPAPAKDDASAKVVAKKPLPLKAAAPAADAGKNAPLAAATATPSSAANANVARPAGPESPLGNTVAPAPTSPQVDEPAPPPPATSTARPALAEPPPLALVKRVEPVLSADLLDSRLNTAKVVVAFTVTTSGEVSNLSVASTSDPRLNRSVLRAVQGWRYAPIPEPREHMVSFAFRTE
jgi:TonB family protein